MRSVIRVMLATLVLAALGFSAAGVYASSRPLVFPKGTVIGGVVVSGLSTARANQALAARKTRLLAPTVSVQAAGHRRTLAASHAVHFDYRPALLAAIHDINKLDPLTRLLSPPSGHDYPVAVSVDAAQVASAVAAASAVTVAPVNARLHLVPSGPVLLPAANGHHLTDPAGLAARVRAGLLGAGPTSLTAATTPVPPAVSTRAEAAAHVPVSIVVNLSADTARLYNGFQLIKTYPVADGRPGHLTPTGLLHITQMQKNPVWHVPDSPWAGELAGQAVRPGAANPIKARWLGLASGVGFHGTPDDPSIGHHASHGCLRMHVADVIDLYNRVSIGTPVLTYRA